METPVKIDRRPFGSLRAGSKTDDTSIALSAGSAKGLLHPLSLICVVGAGRFRRNRQQSQTEVANFVQHAVQRRLVRQRAGQDGDVVGRVGNGQAIKPI